MLGQGCSITLSFGVARRSRSVLSLGHGWLNSNSLLWSRNHLKCQEYVDNLHSSLKELHIDFIHFFWWPWVTDPDPGSCQVCQMVLGETCKRPRLKIPYGSLALQRCLSTWLPENRFKFWHGVSQDHLTKLKWTGVGVGDPGTSEN